MVKNNWLYYSLNLNPSRQLRNANVQTAKCTCEAKIPVATIPFRIYFYSSWPQIMMSPRLCVFVRLTHKSCAVRLAFITGLRRPKEAVIAGKSRELIIERLVKIAENLCCL